MSAPEIILTSGYNDVLSASDNQFTLLAKPFDLATLDQAVRRALSQISALAPD